MKRNNSKININKYLILSIVFLFVVMLIRLLFLSLSSKIDNIDLKAFASNRNTIKSTLYATRGTIYDKNGEILAQNVNSYTVIAFLSSKRTTNENKPQHVIDKLYTAKVLSPLINMTEEEILKLLNKDVYQVELGPGGRNISESKKEEIDALDLPGISFISSSKRWYKMGDFASYLIGYAKKDDNDEIVGEMGVEKEYNESLKGKDGYKIYQKDGYGYQIPNTPESIVDPVSGNDIYLTIDNNIQIILENALDKFENEYEFDWLTFTIANAKTGAIVASASSPSFDPNVLDINNYMVPLSQYTYEPGSTMKIYSFMASMEAGVYNGSEKYKSGSMKIGEYTISDFNDIGFGTITFDEGFGYSSNIAAANLAKKLEKNYLLNYYKKLGFGKKTGIELGDEYTGKLSFKYEIEIANASFGQGLTTTPIQNIQALSSIANDGIMLKPYLIEKIVDQKGNIIYKGERTEIDKVASKQTTDKMKELMKSVVYGGFTSASQYAPENITLIGKTGTAQIAKDTGKGYMDGKYDVIKSFAGIFPYEDPEYILYVSLKRGIVSYNALPTLVKSVVEDVAQTKSITENENAFDKSKIITIQSYLSKKISLLSDNGLNNIVLGDGEYIIDQFPKYKTKVNYGTKLFLVTNSTNFIMPDVTGWSSSDIITFCNLVGLKYNLDGFGYVESTSIPIGSRIDPNIEISIILKDNNLNKDININEESN